MGTLLISLLTLVLLLISAFVILIVLMQRTSQAGGMGAALGGGAAESAFGSETNNILMKGTVYGIVAFFIVALSLFLLYQSAYVEREPEVDMGTLIRSGAEEGSTAEPITPILESSDGNEAANGTVLEAEGSAREAGEAAGTEAVESSDSNPAEVLPDTN